MGHLKRDLHSSIVWFMAGDGACQSAQPTVSAPLELLRKLRERQRIWKMWCMLERCIVLGCSFANDCLKIEASNFCARLDGRCGCSEVWGSRSLIDYLCDEMSMVLSEIYNISLLLLTHLEGEVNKLPQCEKIR